MTAEIVALAADHAGYELKEELKGELVARGFEVLDLGTNGPDSVDYPDYGDAIARALRLIGWVPHLAPAGPSPAGGSRCFAGCVAGVRKGVRAAPLANSSWEEHRWQCPSAYVVGLQLMLQHHPVLLFGVRAPRRR